MGKMSKVFSWEYFSFLQVDTAMAYKEVLVIPCLIIILSLVWMKLVKGQTEEKADLNFEQAYQDAVANEADSGTELDSQAEDDGEEEIEEIGAVEDEEVKTSEEKKDE